MAQPEPALELLVVPPRIRVTTRQNRDNVRKTAGKVCYLRGDQDGAATTEAMRTHKKITQIASNGHCQAEYTPRRRLRYRDRRSIQRGVWAETCAELETQRQARMFGPPVWIGKRPTPWGTPASPFPRVPDSPFHHRPKSTNSCHRTACAWSPWLKQAREATHPPQRQNDGNNWISRTVTVTVSH